MSAIAGLCFTDGRAAVRLDLERMLAALIHRGTDDAGAWAGGPAALGHAALWTTPESRRERQPLATGQGHAMITADARLDNRAELIAALGLADADLGDAELILRAWERWGEASVPRLLGDFAFAIWDSRQQTLFCARDHIGVRPFYYAQAPGAFLFASEIKALLTSPLIPYRLNPARVADHLVGLHDDRTTTFYRDVWRLPPGHLLCVSRDGLRLRPYWSLEPTAELRLGSDEAYAAAFRECLAEAVSCRLRSSHPVGCLLSGGLEAAAIVGTARGIRARSADENLATFTAIFPGLPPAELRTLDERALVAAIVRQGGLDPHDVRGDLLSPLVDVDRALWHLDEAFSAPDLYLRWALFGAARDQGVRPLLDGMSGDTVVSHGLERFAALLRTGRVVTLASELRALSRRCDVDVASLVWQYSIQPLVPAPVHALVERVRRRQPPAWMTDSAIKPEFARRAGVVERAETAGRAHWPPARSAREAHGRRLSSGIIPHALEVADKAAAAFGVEPRYPFLDRRLMELCLSMPVEQKLGDGWTRLVLRRAMRGVLPEEVRWRNGTANLATNFKRRLLEHDRDVVEMVVGNPESIEDFVDVPALRRAYGRCLTRRMSDADAVTVYRAVVLGLWLQRAKLAA
jgi:asparagine synthase (glutamine-hydrolysing)